MSVSIKVSKRISPKDKNKINTKITDIVSARIEGNKITSVSRSRNVSHNKKHK